MKKSLIYSIILVLLLISIIPVTVLAGKPKELVLDVRNRTSAEVELRVTDEFGISRFYTIPAGVTTLTLQEGSYSYYASLPCGNLAGMWNVNVMKTLMLDCEADQPSVDLVGKKECISVIKVDVLDQVGGPFPEGNYYFDARDLPNDAKSTFVNLFGFLFNDAWNDTANVWGDCMKVPSERIQL